MLLHLLAPDCANFESVALATSRTHRLRAYILVQLPAVDAPWAYVRNSSLEVFSQEDKIGLFSGGHNDGQALAFLCESHCGFGTRSLYQLPCGRHLVTSQSYPINDDVDDPAVWGKIFRPYCSLAILSHGGGPNKSGPTSP
jgi:hypothetical protein